MPKTQLDLKHAKASTILPEENLNKKEKETAPDITAVFSGSLKILGINVVQMKEMVLR